MSREFILTSESEMPKRNPYTPVFAEPQPLTIFLSKAFALGIVIPGIAWFASNFIATSPLLSGIAFRDLAAVGLFNLSGLMVFNTYRR